MENCWIKQPDGSEKFDEIIFRNNSIELANLAAQTVKDYKRSMDFHEQEKEC